MRHTRGQCTHGHRGLALRSCGHDWGIGSNLKCVSPRALTWQASHAAHGSPELAPARKYALALSSTVAEPVLFCEQPRSRCLDQQSCRVAHVGDCHFAPRCVPGSDRERRACRISRTKYRES